METLVNTDKLYSLIGRFFSNHQSLTTELIQNSVRAKAKQITVAIPYNGEHPFKEIETAEKLLRIEDDGKGITDPVALLGIAISKWDSDIDVQDPAGMGFLQLIALSKQVSVQSKFGHLIFDSQRFLNDGNYRQKILSSVNKDEAIAKGTVIIAEMNSYHWDYIHHSKDCYKGYYNTDVTINGELMEYRSIDEMCNSAKGNNNLYSVHEFKGNRLFVEIGDKSSVGSGGNTLVNWYGQFIIVYFTNCIANSKHISFYYEVRNGTPLTPRYPDRHSLIEDELYGELKKFVCGIAFEMIKDYFNNMQSMPKFATFINHNLLLSYYEHATPDEMHKIPYLPVELNILGSQDYAAMSISTKQSLTENGYSYCYGIDRINDEYLLAGERAELKTVRVNRKVAEHLKELGIPELVEAEIETKPENLININPLVLLLTYADGTKRNISLEKALLIDDLNNVYVYTDNSQDALSVFSDLFDYNFLHEDDRSSDDIYDDIVDSLRAEMIKRFSIINRSKFHFLPEYAKIKNIEFGEGNLAVAYQDGTTFQFTLKQGL